MFQVGLELAKPTMSLQDQGIIDGYSTSHAPSTQHKGNSCPGAETLTQKRDESTKKGEARYQGALGGEGAGRMHLDCQANIPNGSWLLVDL